MARHFDPHVDLTGPEQYAAGHRRGSGPPNEERRPDRGAAQSAHAGRLERNHDTTRGAMRSIGEILPETLAQLQALYGRRE